MMQQKIREDAAGSILFDAAVCPQVDASWFVPEHWNRQGRLRMQAGGRGGVAVIVTPAGECILRHYRRGGVVARLMGDRYLWTGRGQTRSFREFRLLVHIVELGLPGPVPVAARAVRRGLYYRADLITRRIEHAHTLAECLAQGRLDAELAAEVGALVARFHREGVWHADLNAHNVLVAPTGLYLIDFDRGRLREPDAGWRWSNLKRLRRSLVKLGAGRDPTVFETQVWVPLIDQYEETLAA